MMDKKTQKIGVIKSRKYYNLGIIFMLWNFIVKLEY